MCGRLQAAAKPAAVEPAGDGEADEEGEDGAAANAKVDKKSAPTSLSRKVCRSDASQNIHLFFLEISMLLVIRSPFFISAARRLMCVWCVCCTVVL